MSPSEPRVLNQGVLVKNSGMLKKTFRAVAYLEGLSYLLLLFVAMPLKYVWHKPMAVSLVGQAHGALFLTYLFFLPVVFRAFGWSLKTVSLALLAAFLPFGPFVFDRVVLTDRPEL